MAPLVIPYENVGAAFAGKQLEKWTQAVQGMKGIGAAFPPLAQTHDFNEGNVIFLFFSHSSLICGFFLSFCDCTLVRHDHADRAIATTPTPIAPDATQLAQSCSITFTVHTPSV